MKSSLVSTVIHVVVFGLVMLYGARDVIARPRPPEPRLLVYQDLVPRVVKYHSKDQFDGRTFGDPDVIIDDAPPDVPTVDVAVPGPPGPIHAGPIVDSWSSSRDSASGDQSGPHSGTPTGPLSADVVDVPVTPYPGAPTPRYPDALREAGVEGDVILEFVVDTTGRVEGGSVRVIEKTTDAFVVSVRDALAGTRYHPALVAGRRVRQLVRQGFVFSLTQR